MDLEREHPIALHSTCAVYILLSQSAPSCFSLETAGLALGLVLPEHGFGLWQLLGW